MKECDILGGQSILWRLIHIFRPQPPGSMPLPWRRRFLSGCQKR